MHSTLLKKDVRKAKKVLDFGRGIGKWRVESNKVNYISQRYSWRHNEIPAIPVYKSEREEADDDWDVEKQFVKGLSDERGWCWKRNM